MWRKEKAGFPNVFNGSSQFSFIWAATLLGVIELLSRLFEMHRVRLWFFAFCVSVPLYCAGSAVAYMEELIQLKNNLGKNCISAESAFWYGSQCGCTSSTAGTTQDIVAGQGWMARQGKVCLSCVTFDAGQTLSDMPTRIKKMLSISVVFCTS